VFFNDFNGFYIYIRENDFFIGFPMFLLSLCSIFLGFFFSDIFLGLGTPFLGNSFFVLVFHYCFLDSEIISPFLRNLPILFFFIGFFIGFFIYNFFSSFVFEEKNNICYKYYFFVYNLLLPFFSSAFFFNFFYNETFRVIYKSSYNIFTKTLEKGFFEFYGSFGLYRLSFIFFLLF
jgi:NADH-ubiquinone oxidoreductase chain 5